MLFVGFASLVKAGIIARSEMPNMYFINPLIVFNGNRITFAKTYIKKQKANPNQVSLLDQPGVMQ